VWLECFDLNVIANFPLIEAEKPAITAKYNAKCESLLIAEKAQTQGIFSFCKTPYQTLIAWIKWHSDYHGSSSAGAPEN